jgi:hypothetical protein
MDALVLAFAFTLGSLLGLIAFIGLVALVIVLVLKIWGILLKDWRKNAY